VKRDWLRFPGVDVALIHAYAALAR